MKNSSVIWSYVIRGIAIGFIFPIGAYICCVSIFVDTIAVYDLKILHKTFPLLWIIDLAPIVLGAISLMVGRSVGKVNKTSSSQIEKANTKLLFNLQIINKFSSIIQNSETIDDVVWSVAKNAVAQLNYVDVVIYLVDDSGKYLIQKAAHGNKNPNKREILDPIKIKIGEGVVGSVAASRKAEIINDTSKDPRYLLDDVVRYSEITVPIVHHNEIIGVIDSEHPEKNFYPDDHLELLTTIASMTGTKLIQTKFNNELKSYQFKLEKLVSKRTKELEGKTREVEKKNIKLKQLAMFPEFNPNPVIELNFEYEIVYINKSAENHFKNTPLLDINDPSRKKYRDLLANTMKGKKTGVYNIEQGFYINGKNYDFNIYTDNEFKLFRLYFNDVTEIRNMQDELKTQRDSIYDSLKYAQRIQKAILPDLSFVKNFFEDYFILYKPKDIVSGDFYWAKTHDDKLLFAMCDCTGHGVPGAFMSIIGNNTINSVVKHEVFSDTSDILNAINVIFHRNVVESKYTVMDTMDMIMVYFDKKTKKLNFSGCLQQFYIIRDEEILSYKTDSIPLGMAIDGDVFRSENVSLKKGDVIYLFSDGYPDQFGGPRGKKFKYKPFRELLLSIYQKPMHEQEIILNETILSWQNNHGVSYEQIDDISIVGFKI
jgi:serine phosphatase RsbU (regulator of sigma subunit)/putative methionine-R-sulfoxide reductase with GAF domain